MSKRDRASSGSPAGPKRPRVVTISDLELTSNSSSISPRSSLSTLGLPQRDIASFFTPHLPSTSAPSTPSLTRVGNRQDIASFFRPRLPSSSTVSTRLTPADDENQRVSLSRNRLTNEITPSQRCLPSQDRSRSIYATPPETAAIKILHNQERTRQESSPQLEDLSGLLTSRNQDARSTNGDQHHHVAQDKGGQPDSVAPNRAPLLPSLVPPDVPAFGEDNMHLSDDDEQRRWAHQPNRPDQGNSTPTTPTPTESPYRPSDRPDQSPPDTPHPSEDMSDELDNETESSSTDVERAVDWLYRTFTLANSGCGSEAHQTKHQQHLQQEGEHNHFPLSATYNRNIPYSRIPNRCPVGLTSGRDPKRQGESRRSFIAAPYLREVFEGRSHDDEPVRNICLHTEHVADTTCKVEYDIDSIIAFPDSLAAFKVPVRLIRTLHTSFNLKSDLHIKIKVQYTPANGRTRNVQRSLHEIPHLYIGTIDEIYHSTIFILFPRLIDESKTTNFLSTNQADRFFTKAFWPACRRYLSNAQLQHHPAGQSTAKMKARARGVEHQSAQRDRGLQEHKLYPYHPDALGAIWSDILETIADPHAGMQDFRGARLLLDAKNLKLDFKCSGSLGRTLSEFRTFLWSLLDREQCKASYDIGMEICPAAIRETEEGDGDDDQPNTVYLWKSCCLQNMYQSLVDGPFGGKQGSVNCYRTGLLEEAQSMTIVPPRRSAMKLAGCHYLQWYGSWKEPADASKIIPFDHPDLGDLAIDEDVYGVSNGHTHVRQRDKRRKILRSWDGSKRRASVSLNETKATSFGDRFEARVDDETGEGIQHRCSDAEHEARLILSDPEFCWAVTTPSFFDFMLGNYDKFTATVEMVMATCPNTGVTLERTKVLAALIKCLQNFSSGHLQRHSLLYFDERHTPTGVRRGLGFETTLQRHKYGWFLPRIDWEMFRFVTAVEQEMTGFDRNILAAYQESARLLQDTYPLLECCFRTLKVADAYSEPEYRALLALAHFCLRQYRRDVIDALIKQREIRSTVQSHGEIDTLKFSHEGLRSVFMDEMHFVAGGKTLCTQPEQVFAWLFGDEAGYPRNFFGTQKQYRIMTKRVDELTRTQGSLRKRWRKCLEQEFFDYHWVVPYPDTNGTLISTTKKQGKRQFWALDRNEATRTWRWARSHPRSGVPHEFPPFLTMDAVRFSTYMERGY